MAYDKIIVPREGRAVTIKDDLSLHFPNDPIIPFIEGDGIGAEVTPTMKKVVDAAVQKAYGSEKKIYWMEVYCGEKASKIYEGDCLPEETLEAIEAFIFCIKGPLNTPIDDIRNKDGFKRADIKDINIKTFRTDQEEVGEAVAEEISNEAVQKATIYQAITHDSESREFSELKSAGLDKANPVPLILSAEMMLRDMGWIKGADLIIKAVESAIANRTTTDDAEPVLPDEVTPLNCSEFGDAIISEMKSSEKK